MLIQRVLPPNCLSVEKDNMLLEIALWPLLWTVYKLRDSVLLAYGACTGLYTGIVTGSLDNMVQKRLVTPSINLNWESIQHAIYIDRGDNRGR